MGASNQAAKNSFGFYVVLLGLQDNAQGLGRDGKSKGDEK